MPPTGACIKEELNVPSKYSVSFCHETNKSGNAVAAVGLMGINLTNLLTAFISVAGWG